MDEITASHVVHVRRVIGDVVTGKMYIITDAVLLSGKTGRESQFEGGNRRHILHERFLGYVPCECSRREESPPVRLGELAGAVSAGREREHIAGIDRIIDTSIEGYHVVFMPVCQVS